MSTTTTLQIPSKDTVAQLRHLANNDKVFNAVMHRFAIRERARAQVTIQTLRTSMEKEGFKELGNEGYAKVLKALADLKVGTLKRNRNGRITALTNIKMRLQSIGKAALGAQDKIENMGFKATYSNLMPKNAPQFTESDTKEYAAILTVMMHGKAINFPLPPITGGDLGFLLADLYSGGSNQNTKGRA